MSFKALYAVDVWASKFVGKYPEKWTAKQITEYDVICLTTFVVHVLAYQIDILQEMI